MKKVIGIDLGTTNTVCAFHSLNTEILDIYNDGKLVKSCVGEHENTLKVGIRVFNQLLRYSPKKLIRSIKRFMGKSIKDENVIKIN